MILRLWRRHLEKRRRQLFQQAENADGADRDRIRTECSHLTIDLKRLREGWEAALPILELEAL